MLSYHRVKPPDKSSPDRAALLLRAAVYLIRAGDPAAARLALARAGLAVVLASDLPPKQIGGAA